MKYLGADSLHDTEGKLRWNCSSERSASPRSRSALPRSSSRSEVHAVAADPADRIRTAVTQLEAARVERDEAIRAAAAGEPKMSPTEIARASGLSRMQVYRILEA